MDNVVAHAVSVLRHDGIIVYPTDTVYGLGADALSEIAVHRVYLIKNREISNPTSIAVSDADMMRAVAIVDEIAEEFIDRFMPGPVTAVVKMKRSLPPVLGGGADLIGIRMPDCAVTLRIIEELDAPITATSANPAGEIAPCHPADVTVERDYLVDGGELPGTPSTVADLVNMRVIREGVLCEEVAAFLATFQ